MLHWLAGQKHPDGLTDGDAIGFTEPPETPAPVFAVRAFKHAIFGTPQTQPHARRHSNTEHARPKNIDPKPPRPGMNRPKSSSDAYIQGKQDAPAVVSPLGSPTKGILMTPGTAAARKKNVTFGEHVMDNEEKRPLKGEPLDDCPGKVPSSFNKDSPFQKNRDESPDKGGGRSKLTEALEQAREESRSRKSKAGRRAKYEDEGNDIAADLDDPTSGSGKYWKREYDIYRENTQREVKKLITKQKAAKGFAQAKDSECTELADQLKQEQKKVESLEAKMAELAMHMKDLQDKLRASQDTERKHQELIASLKRQLGRRDSARPGSSDSVPPAPAERREPEQRISRERAKSQEGPVPRASEASKVSAVPEKAKADPVQRPSEPYNPLAVPEKSTIGIHTLRGRSKSKPENLQANPADDIWAQSLRSSSPLTSRTTSRPQMSPSGGGRTVTSGTDATPLKTLSINTLASGREAKSQGSSPQSMDVECKSMPDAERIDRRKANEGDQEWRDAPVSSSNLPLGSPEPRSTAKQTSTKRKDTSESGHQPLISLPSSPFQPNAKTSPPFIEAGMPDSKMVIPNHSTKENVSPTSKPTSPPGDAKPSVMWSSINVSQAAKQRSTSMVGKDGKEVSMDRIEAAKARLAARGAARGRGVS